MVLQPATRELPCCHYWEFFCLYVMSFTTLHITTDGLWINVIIISVCNNRGFSHVGCLLYFPLLAGFCIWCQTTTVQLNVWLDAWCYCSKKFCVVVHWDLFLTLTGQTEMELPLQHFCFWTNKTVALERHTTIVVHLLVIVLLDAKIRFKKSDIANLPK